MQEIIVSMKSVWWMFGDGLQIIRHKSNNLYPGFPLDVENINCVEFPSLCAKHCTVTGWPGDNILK